jgi:hypothetical protein
MATIRVVALALTSGRRAISYEELGEKLGLNGMVARGHGPTLAIATLICRDYLLPDIAPCVVTSASMKAGKPMPSEKVFDENGFWADSGLTLTEVEGAQIFAAEFDWNSVKVLWGAKL